MTREEAIKNREDCMKYLEGLGQKASPDCLEAVRWSVKALKALRPVSREQIEKAWRSFWEQGDIYDFGDVCQKCGYDSGNEPCRMSFCPACGAPMTDEAVDILLKRLEALKDETD